MYPYMGSVMVALDRSTRENGCLQVLRGSHLAGRVNHGVLPGEQIGADMTRVDQMRKTMDLVYAEMEPGDGLFFHANVMHRSDQNRSPNRRWTVLFCFNAARNDPFLQHQHPGYTPLCKVPDSAVKAAGVKLSTQGAEQFRRASARPAELAEKGS
jgi:ectoine hydroxylase